MQQVRTKKHHTQMSTEEIAALKSVAKTRNYQPCDHVIHRMQQRNISPSHIKSAIYSGDVIEVSRGNRYGDVRVLFQKNVGNRFVSAVVNLANNEVVTVWTNNLSDSHATLDISQYDWKGDVRAVLA